MGHRGRTRILLLSQAPGVGGGERSVLMALARLKQIDVTVAAPRPVCSFAESLGLRTIRLKLPRAHKLSQIPMIAIRSRRIVQIARNEGAAVLYANGTRAMPYGLAARLLGGPPLVAHHHGLFTTGPTRWLVAGLKRWAGAIVVPSKTSASDLEGAGDVQVIPNGIDLDHFRPALQTAEAKQALGLPRQAQVVGMVGRANPDRGMNQFLDLIRRLSSADPEVRFLLAGGAAFPHEKVHYERVRKRAAETGDRLVLTGFLKDPISAYGAMDVFVHLAEPEGFGMTVVEAMACAIPVVAYNWGGVAEIVESGLTGILVKPGDLQAAADAVMRLLSDEEQRRSMGSRARMVCEERYGVERYAADISSVVFSVASMTQ